MVQQFNSMIYYNSNEIVDFVKETLDFDCVVSFLIVLWLNFYPNTDNYDLAFITGLAEDYAENALIQI